MDEAVFPTGFLSAWWADTQDDDPAVGSVRAMQIPQFIEPFNNGAHYCNTLYARNVGTLRAYAADSSMKNWEKNWLTT